MQCDLCDYRMQSRVSIAINCCWSMLRANLCANLYIKDIVDNVSFACLIQCEKTRRDRNANYLAKLSLYSLMPRIAI